MEISRAKKSQEDSSGEVEQGSRCLLNQKLIDHKVRVINRVGIDIIHRKMENKRGPKQTYTYMRI